MKIAIVGTHPETWQKVPELDKEWEVWRFSRGHFEKPPKFTRWFEIHHPRNYRRYDQACPGYTDFLKKVKATTYETFPWQNLLEEFGPYFFSGGQAPWIMAYAITRQPDTIGLWGINPRGDYKPQLSEIQYFISVARYRGIEVIAPEDPEVLKHRDLYALEKDFSQAEAIQAIFTPSLGTLVQAESVPVTRLTSLRPA